MRSIAGRGSGEADREHAGGAAALHHVERLDRHADDDGERVMKPGDVCIQVGSWHAWQESIGSRTAFIMMGAKFEE